MFLVSCLIRTSEKISKTFLLFYERRTSTDVNEPLKSLKAIQILFLKILKGLTYFADFTPIVLLL